MSETMHSCEICGIDGFTDDGLQSHTHSNHMNQDGDPVCPFCDLSGVSARDMAIHVNCVHLDYLTPDREAISFIDEDIKTSNEEGAQNPMDTQKDVHQVDQTGICAGNTLSSSQRGGPVLSEARHGHGSPLRSNLALHLENKATPKLLECPLCTHTDASAQKLEEHVNREHLDLMSPGITTQQQVSTSDDYSCPLCVCKMSCEEDLVRHVNLDHSDILSPQKAVGGNSPRVTGGSQGEGCPYCKKSGFSNDHQLALHLEQHFIQHDQLLARAVEMQERDYRRQQEEREFKLLKAQYGMDNQGNFREQSARNMQRAVETGELTVKDYYEKTAGLRVAETIGIDDGSSRTKNVINKIFELSSMSSNVVRSYVCTAVDHYGCTYGDKGWGCGYRNAQMMISSLLEHTAYNQVLQRTLKEPEKNSNQLCAMPSISRLQKLIEWAWSTGFDPQGCDQLGGQLHNSRKWIGTTEMKTLLSSMRIRTELVDFHRPTGADGSHPELFNWVLQYFQKKESFKPPLYLQHQGHSRTIVGAEVLRNGVNLLVFDPSHTVNQMALFNDTRNGATAMRLIRKASGAMRARQYQLLSVCGIMQSDQEYQESKIFRSTRIPHD